jgi:hypothetical protein
MRLLSVEPRLVGVPNPVKTLSGRDVRGGVHGTESIRIGPLLGEERSPKRVIGWREVAPVG